MIRSPFFFKEGQCKDAVLEITMRISFDNSNRQIERLNKPLTTDSSNKTKGIGSFYEEKSVQGETGNYEGALKSLGEVKTKAMATDVDAAQDYMTVMSASMSDEDYAKMVATGEKPEAMEVEDAVTIIDKIKLEMARGGANVKGFTDTLDAETIKELTGLETIANELTKEDVSVTEDMCREISEAAGMAKELTEMSDEMKRFLVLNDHELTIDNIYLSKHSVCEDVKTRGGEYFNIEAKGYIAKKGTEISGEALKEEVIKLLSDMGIKDVEENVDNAKWLVSKSLPVNEENLERLNEIKKVSLPLTDEKISKSIAIAITEGNLPKDASVIKEESIYSEAVRLTNELDNIVSSEFVKETRIMEETRLKMMTEANLLLIKSGYKIDTKALEEYVEKLKEIEKTPAFNEAVEIERVETTVKSIKEMPVAIIAPVAPKVSLMTLNEVKEAAEPIKKRYDIAGVAYEKVQTEVRKDLGDSIKKAFRNVSSILEEMGLEDTKENTRAVRILGYNSMPISKDNIEAIKEADRKLQGVITRLTPYDTLKLIRDGRSPIKMSVDELNQYLDEKTDNQGEEIEKYSKFLYKLERDKEITPSERKEYIEVYRFFHQIEKTEAAAVGSVINAGWELNFENLKTAYKASKHKGMDVTIGEKYEALVSDDPTDALQKEWLSHKLDEIREALDAPKETVTELVMNDIAVTAQNLEAALNLQKKRGKAFEKAAEASEGRAKEKALKFTDNISEKEDTYEAYDEMISECKKAVYDECMMSDNFIDVRALQSVHMQLSLANSYAFHENYEVPMEIGGQVTSVNVKLVHNSKEDPNVAVSFENEEYGRVSARLYMQKGEINGYIACNLKEAVTKMQKVADKLSTKVSAIWTAAPDNDLTLSRIPMRENTEVSSNELYGIAKKFLESMKG